MVAVHVWWADLRQADIALARSLPPAERERVMAVERPADRGRRLVAATLVQHAVAHVRGAGHPGARRPVEVDRTCPECGAQHGRPVVAGGPHLSVSHAGVLVVVVACAGARVGVDVERTARFGGSQERTLAWVRHEAALKAEALAGGDGEPAGTIRVLRPPLPGYASALYAPLDTSLVRHSSPAYPPRYPLG